MTLTNTNPIQNVLDLPTNTRLTSCLKGQGHKLFTLHVPHKGVKDQNQTSQTDPSSWGVSAPPTSWPHGVEVDPAETPSSIWSHSNGPVCIYDLCFLVRRTPLTSCDCIFIIIIIIDHLIIIVFCCCVVFFLTCMIQIVFVFVFLWEETTLKIKVLFYLPSVSYFTSDLFPPVLWNRKSSVSPCWSRSGLQQLGSHPEAAAPLEDGRTQSLSK